MVRLTLLIACLAFIAGCARADPAAPVRIDTGSLQGVSEGDTIAYAAPPIGPAR
jgi:hypothetical protein